MSGHSSEGQREFVGFVWRDGHWDDGKEGVLVEARDAAEARELIREEFGSAIGISLWNEDDAAGVRRSSGDADDRFAALVDGGGLEAAVPGLKANPPATLESLAAVENDLGFALPSHYCDFLLQADGCEGPGGEGYIALWSTEDLAMLNRAYSIGEFVPGLLLVGSDGGDTAYALDLRRDAAPVVSLPFLGMEDRWVAVLAATVADLLVLSKPTSGGGSS